MSGAIQKFVFEGDDKDQLKLAVRIMMDTSVVRLTHYVSDTVGTAFSDKEDQLKPFISFLWGTPGRNSTGIGEPVPFLSPISDAGMVTDLTWNWLQQLKSEQFGNYTPHDGDTKRGFKITCDAPRGKNFQYSVPWSSYCIMTIYPCWIEYGK